ncbi:MAG TPA: YqgE/AlgH family protein [Spirochaetota bacterium]|nr:YqgE/AlgH family protein [Spirochaetota bacterium]
MIKKENFDFSTSYSPVPGAILISSVNMLDPNFHRSVIFICEHNDNGTFGLILNKVLSALELNTSLDDMFKENIRLYHGGPVQVDTLHFLHTRASVSGCKEILPGLFWGGDFDEVRQLVYKNEIRENEIRFFIGYSGWGKGQLVEELKRKSWYVAPGTSDLIFNVPPDEIWKEAIKKLGPGFQLLLHYPDDLSNN